MWPFKHIDTDKVCNSTFLQRWCEKSNSHHHHYDHAKVNDVTYQSRSSSRPCDFRKIAVFCPQHRHMPEDIIRWTNHRALWVHEGCLLNLFHNLQHQCPHPYTIRALLHPAPVLVRPNCFTSFCAHITRNIASDTVQPYCRWGLHDLTLPKAGLKHCCFNFVQYGSEWRE